MHCLHRNTVQFQTVFKCCLILVKITKKLENNEKVFQIKTAASPTICRRVLILSIVQQYTDIAVRSLTCHTATGTHSIQYAVWYAIRR